MKHKILRCDLDASINQDKRYRRLEAEKRSVTGNSSKRKEKKEKFSVLIERRENKDAKGKDRNTTVALAILW